MTTFGLRLASGADMVVKFEVGGRPSTVTRYAVILRILDPDDRATAVRVYDNAHGVDEHHMHRCDRAGNRRQPPEIFHHGSPVEALMEARRLVENGFEEMIAGWRR